MPGQGVDERTVPIVDDSPVGGHTRGMGEGVEAHGELTSLHGVEATAYLVNESRARRPELSRDPLAPQWIPPERRCEIADLWDSYAQAVSPHDDLAVSLRCRSILTLVSDVLDRHPQAVLVSVGAGFTSYPYLAPVAAALEVDLPGNVAAKDHRRRELIRDGTLAQVDVTLCALDVSEPGAVEELHHRAQAVADGRPVIVVIEGLLYYLGAPTCASLLGLVGRLGGQVAGAAVSYWPQGTEHHPVIERQRAWFRDLGISPDSTHLPTAEVLAALGPTAVDESPDAQQSRAGCDRVVPRHELIPEHVATIRT